MPIDYNTLSIISTVAVFFAGGGFWLRGQFASIKEAVKSEIAAHETRDHNQFEAIRTRIAVIETKAEINRHDIIAGNQI